MRNSFTYLTIFEHVEPLQEDEIPVSFVGFIKVLSPMLYILMLGSTEAIESTDKTVSVTAAVASKARH